MSSGVVFIGPSGMFSVGRHARTRAFAFWNSLVHTEESEIENPAIGEVFADRDKFCIEDPVLDTVETSGHVGT